MERDLKSDKERRVLLFGAPGLMRDAAAEALEGEGWAVRASEELGGAPEEYQALIVVADLKTDDHPAGLGPTLGALFERIDSAIKYVRPGMSRTGGAIVVVAPSLGSETKYGVTLTSVVQRALSGLARGLALELGDEGIRANTILSGVLREASAPLPGVIPLMRAGDADRRGTVQDIAQAVAYLVSEDASYITGIELAVDGGLSQCRSSAWTALWDAEVIDAFTEPSAMFA